MDQIPSTRAVPWARLRGMGTGVLDRLAESERRALLSQMQRRRFAKGEVVFHEGDPGDTLHLIAKGHVAVQVGTPRGDRVVLRVLGPDSLVGEFALLAAGPRSATVTAIDAVETRTLNGNGFAKLRTDHVDLDHFLLGLAINEVRRLSAALLDAMYLPAEQRVLRRLVEMAELFGDGDSVVVPLGQEDLAGLAGVTRQSVNKVLANAEQAGLVARRRGSIEILDLPELTRRSS